MKLPGITECFQLMDSYEMLPNIKKHSVVVAEVCEHIIDDLGRTNGRKLDLPNRDLIIAGALLHDIGKTHCIHNHCDHAAFGAEICKKHGYPELAEIVAEHVVLSDHDNKRYAKGQFTASEIVYYGDKRVLHENIVSLRKRLEYIIRVYGKGDFELHKRILKNFDMCVQMEQHLFSFLSFTPEILSQRLQTTMESSPETKY